MSPCANGRVSLGSVYRALVVLMVMVLLLKKCDGDTCTLSNIQALQSDISISLDKLDGHWYVSKVYGAGNGTYPSYTVDVVPTVSGLVLYTNSNKSSTVDCTYVAHEYNATSKTYIFSNTNVTTGSLRTMIVAASDSDVQNVLLYQCANQVLNPSDPCGDTNILLMGKQATPGTADAWLTSLTSSLPCWTSGTGTVSVQQGEECPLKPMWGLNGRDCLVANMMVQENFNLSEYTKEAWLEMTWLAPFYMDPSTFYQDYVHNYTVLQNGSILCNVTARDPGQNNKCLRYPLLLSTTATPGELILNDPGKGEVPYNVMSTDYDHYALVFGCYELTLSGKCKAARGWLWSRDATLERSYRLMVNSMIMDLCVNPAAWFNTEQNNPCDKYTGGCSSPHITTILLGAMAVLTLFITT